MEIAKAEIDVVKAVVVKADEEQVRELNDLQLALVGGGIADPMIG